MYDRQIIWTISFEQIQLTVYELRLNLYNQLFNRADNVDLAANHDL